MHSLRSKRSSILGWCLILGSITLLGAGCGDDDDDSTSSGGAGGKGGSSATGGKSSGSGGESAGGEGPEGGTPGAGGTGASDGGGSGGGDGLATQFTIPDDGGNVDVELASGNSLNFEFPASAGGLTVTLTPTTADSIGWDGAFDDVIQMEPDGQTFDDPIVIRSSNNDLLVFDFASTGDQGPAEGLALNGDGDGLLLNHFSTLAILPPGVSCNSESGWNAIDDDDYCSEQGAATTKLEYGCKAYTYCLFIGAKCCVEPGGDAHQPCELGMDALTLSYTPTDTNGGQFPYCAVDDGSGGAGGTGNGAGGAGGATSSAGGAGGAGGDPGAGGAGGAGSGSSCFSSGTTGSPAGSGTCASPRQLALAQLGDTVKYTASSGDDAWTVTSACATSPTRTDVYQINPPVPWNSIDVSVDAASGVDTKISFMESDVACNTEDSCINDVGTNACEAASATQSQLNTNAIFVAIHSFGSSGPVTANFAVH